MLEIHGEVQDVPDARDLDAAEQGKRAAPIGPLAWIQRAAEHDSPGGTAVRRVEDAETGHDQGEVAVTPADWKSRRFDTIHTGRMTPRTMPLPTSGMLLSTQKRSWKVIVPVHAVVPVFTSSKPGPSETPAACRMQSPPKERPTSVVAAASGLATAAAITGADHAAPLTRVRRSIPA